MADHIVDGALLGWFSKVCSK